MKIIHVMLDDKFNDMAIREFEAVAPGMHEYVMIDTPQPFRYVKHEGIRNMSEEVFSQEMRRGDLAAVMFHSLPSARYRLLGRIPTDKKVFWFGWGYDYYHLLDSAFPEGLLLRRTAELCRSGSLERLRGKTRSLYRKFLRVVGSSLKLVDLSELKRVDYFSPVLDVEYELVRTHNPWLRAKYLCWNYGTVEDDLSLPELEGMEVGNNLLVGNSAAATNNHLEMFERIREKIDLKDRKVIVPLSYGDMAYREKILRLGRDMLGPSFTPLVDYMPREQYIGILSSCGFVMMNHIRQQALGNICITILLGAKVFLNRHNPLYDWLRVRGVTVGDIDHPDTVPLTDGERRSNIQSIRSHWGRDSQREMTRFVVETAFADMTFGLRE